MNAGNVVFLIALSFSVAQPSRALAIQNENNAAASAALKACMNASGIAPCGAAKAYSGDSSKNAFFPNSFANGTTYVECPYNGPKCSVPKPRITVTCTGEVWDGGQAKDHEFTLKSACSVRLGNEFSSFRWNTVDPNPVTLGDDCAQKVSGAVAALQSTTFDKVSGVYEDINDDPNLKQYVLDRFADAFNKGYKDPKSCDEANGRWNKLRDSCISPLSDLKNKIPTLKSKLESTIGAISGYQSKLSGYVSAHSCKPSVPQKDGGNSGDIKKASVD
jgi:hypothetical protein